MEKITNHVPGTLMLLLRWTASPATLDVIHQVCFHIQIQSNQLHLDLSNQKTLSYGQGIINWQATFNFKLLYTFQLVSHCLCLHDKTKAICLLWWLVSCCQCQCCFSTHLLHHQKRSQEIVLEIKNINEVMRTNTLCWLVLYLQVYLFMMIQEYKVMITKAALYQYQDCVA